MIEKKEGDDATEADSNQKGKKKKGQDAEVGWTPELSSERDRFKVALGRYFLTNHNNNTDDALKEEDEEEGKEDQRILSERKVPLIETVRTVTKYITELHVEETSHAIKFVFPSLFVSPPPAEIQPVPPIIHVALSIETPSRIVSLTSLAHQDRLSPAISDDGECVALSLVLPLHTITCN